MATNSYQACRQMDERCVKATSVDSNWNQMSEYLLSVVPIPFHNLHPIPIDLQNGICHSTDYGALLYYKRLSVTSLKELCHHISVFLVTEAGWGSPLSNQVRGQCGFVTSRSCHFPVPGRPSWPCARDRACTLVLASEIDFASVLKDAEGPAYLSLQCIAIVSWAYPPL